MLTPKQLKWAAEHDWCVKISDGTLIVADRSVMDGILYTKIYEWRGTFAELRDWAGY
jgi:hypothetical protein